MASDNQRAKLVKALKTFLPKPDSADALVGVGLRQIKANQTALDLHNQIRTVIDDAARVSADDAQLLIGRYWIPKTVKVLATEANLSADQINRLIAKAIENLADALLEIHREQIDIDKLTQRNRLEVQNYDALFGVNSIISEARTALVSTASPWIVALSGIGGAGKTSIADYVTRELIETEAFEDVVWIRAAPQSMSVDRERPAITDKDLIKGIAKEIGGVNRARDFESEARLVKSAFANQRMLLVLDNLETLRDIDAVLDFLKEIANPSKVLITAREFPIEMAQLGIRRLPVNELPFADAAQVLQTHAKSVGGTMLEQTIQSSLEEIYDAVGGSPHALKLVASLALSLPVDAILKDLPNWSLGQVDALYKYIYFKLWHALTPPAKDFLTSMPLISEDGGTLDYIQRISGVEENAISVVQELMTFSLLERRGNAQVQRYGIHRLTKTFLLKDVIEW